MKKVKVLLIQESVMTYRAPIYELINKEVDLEVGYTIKNEIEESSYPIFKMPYKKIGPFTWHKGLNKILNRYDVILFVPHLSLIRLISKVYFKQKYKIVTWSLGVHASYNRLYDLTQPPSFKDRVFEDIQDRADASVFYMPEPIEYWKKYRKINEEQYFVAHNTVAVAHCDNYLDFEKRNSILFVGTLYRQKGVGELVEAYSMAKKEYSQLPKVKIVGKGPEKDSIQKQIIELGLQNDIELCGPIYDEEILKEYFLAATICVSPKQAGLSVLKSLGYGVPFVTRTNAITGGEKTNIIDGENGVLYDTIEELAEIIKATAIEPERFRRMSENAREYYVNVAPPEKMARGVLDAINYALQHS